MFMTRSQAALMLREAARCVELGESLEGYVSWTWSAKDGELAPEGKLEVTAGYRLGTQSSSGYRIITPHPDGEVQIFKEEDLQ